MPEDHQVKNSFHSVKRNAAQERKSIKAGRLLEILQEQVKPTLAVFRVDGIDVVLDILIGVISAVLFVFSLSTTMTYIVYVCLYHLLYIISHFEFRLQIPVVPLNNTV